MKVIAHEAGIKFEWKMKGTYSVAIKTFEFMSSTVKADEPSEHRGTTTGLIEWQIILCTGMR